MLLLEVPYKEKDEAKSLGAKWNSDLKKWYVEKREDYLKFSKWIMHDCSEFIIACDYLYICVGERECFKCKNNTRVVGIGFDNYLYCYRDIDDNSLFLEAEEYLPDTDVHIFKVPYDLDEKIVKSIKNNFNYKERYSKTTKMHGLFNCCEKCDILQGDNFIFNEVDSPFFIDSSEKATKLRLYKVKLKFDYVYSGGFSWGSGDYLIKQYAKIIDVESIDKLDNVLKNDIQYLLS